MSISKRVISDLKADIDSKTAQRKAILSQLSLLDIQIDGYDTIIANMDAEAIGLINPMNSAINEVKSSYEAVIESGCKTDLAWVEIDSWTQLVQGGAGDGSFTYEVTYTKYEVQKNSSLKLEDNYYGIKYYRKPANRDYGSFLVADFVGNVGTGETVIAVTEDDGIPIEIQVGDYITDSIDNPQIFDGSNLPTVVGFGTTQSVGITTTLIGGIENGSNVFAHFGAGSLSNVTSGMVLINDSLQENSFITGFGTTEVVVEYYTSGGILTSGILTCNSVILDKPAIDTVQEDTFSVGIVTISPAVFISTTASAQGSSILFTAFRAGDVDDIDKDFDPLKDPNAPLKIGIIDSSTLGLGHTALYDNSGDPSELQSYNPNKTYVDFSKESKKDCLFKNDGTPRSNVIWDNKNKQCIRKPEPDVGAGKAVYYEGSDNWPIINNPVVLGDQITGYTQSYATLGQTVTVSSATGTSDGVTVGTKLYGPNGQCNTSTINSLYNTISTKESSRDTIISENSPKVQSIIGSTEALRRQRAEKETYAWSLLQASASLRQDIEVLTKEYNKLISMDLTKYE